MKHQGTSRRVRKRARHSRDLVIVFGFCSPGRVSLAVVGASTRIRSPRLPSEGEAQPQGLSFERRHVLAGPELAYY